MSNEPPSDLAALLAGLMGGQSQQEHKEVNVRTEVWVPVLQHAWLGIGLAEVLAGLGLVGLAWVWMARQSEELPSRLLMALAIMVVLVPLDVAWHRLAIRLRLGEIWRRVLGLIAKILVLSLILDVIRLASGDWKLIYGIMLIFGIVLVVTGTAIMWRFGNELYNPLYPRSPWVVIMDRFFEALEGKPTKEVRVIEPYPVHIGSNGNMTAMPIDREEGQQLELSPLFSDLIAFLDTARMRGLSRANMVTEPRVKLPSGARLTRSYYDQMVKLAVQWQIVEPGGDGQAAGWSIDADVRIAMLKKVRDQVRGGTDEVEE